MADGLVEYLVRVDNQASAPLTAAAQSADDAADAARRVQGAFASVDVPVRTAGASMGAAAAATGNLRAQLIDIGIMLQGGANPLTILSTQGPQVAEALGAMSASGAGLGSVFGSLGPVLVAVAAAAGGTFLAYKSMTEETSRAADASAKLTAAKLRLLPVIRETADEALRLKLQSGEVTKAYFDQEMAARKAQRGLADANREPTAAIRELRKEQAGFTAQIGEFSERLQASVIPGARFWGAALDGVTTSVSELEEEVGTQTTIIEANAAAYRQSRDTYQEAASVQSYLVGETRNVAAATMAAMEAERRRAAAAVEAERRKAAAIAEANQRRAEDARITDQAGDALDQLALTVEQYTETEEERVNRIFAGYQEQLALQRGFLEASGLDIQKYADLEVKIEEAKQAELARIREEGQQDAAPEAPTATGVSAAGVIGAVSGGPSGLLSLLGQVGGPIGAGVAAGLGLLRQVGQTTPDGESQFVATFREFFGQLIDALPALGGAIADLATMVIAEVVPALVEAIPAVVAGLVDALPAMMTAIVGALPAISGAIIELMLVGMPRALFEALRLLFTPSFWADMAMAYWEGLKLAARDLGQAIAQALKDIITPFKNDEGTGLFQRGGVVATAARDIGQGVGNAAEGAADWFVGMFASGGYVPRTGLALVHAGERIVPAGASGSAPHRSGRNVTVNVNMPQGAYIGSAADIVRELNRSLGSANLGLRWSDG